MSSIEEVPAETKSYVGNRDELDPEAIRLLRLERVGQEPENLDVLQRMEKKGVPTAEVLTDVEEYLKENKLSIEEAQNRVNTNFRKYKLVEQNLTSQKDKIEENEPEFAVGRQLLAKMKEALKDPDFEWPMEIQYPLADQIYAKAYVDKFETLTIVLGAGTFADVTIDEADKMFSKNLSDINRLTTQLGEEINFIKDQVTTSEVNIAHLYNYNVALKKAAAGIEDKKP